MFNVLRSEHTGRVVLLNFHYGYIHGHYHVDVTDLVKRWRTSVDDEFPDKSRLTVKDICEKLGAVCKEMAIGFLGADVTKNIGWTESRLARIVNLDSLALCTRSSLLDAVVVYGSEAMLRRDAINRETHLRVESWNGRIGAIRKGAVVKGERPLSWAAPESELQRVLQLNTRNPATRIRDFLALQHLPNTYLYLLRYPPPPLSKKIARATFAEAGGHRFFRARRDDDNSDPCGRTADLERVISGASLVEGAQELVVAEIPMSLAFEWRYTGSVTEAVPAIDEARFEQLLAEGGSVSAALNESIEILERLSK